MNLNKTTGNRSIRGGVLKRQARRPGSYTHRFMGPSILLSATDGSQSARNRPQRPVSILLIPRIQRVRPSVACPARRPAPRPEGAGRGLAPGEGGAWGCRFGGQKQKGGRRAAFRGSPRLRFVHLAELGVATSDTGGSRPMERGRGVLGGFMSGVAEALACRPGEVRQWPPPPWLLGPRGGGTYLHPGTGEGHLFLAAGLPLHGG